MYGELAFEKEPDWHYKMQDVTLDILLKTGRFAMIYKASLYKHGKPMECVAKTLRGEYFNCLQFSGFLGVFSVSIVHNHDEK